MPKELKTIKIDIPLSKKQAQELRRVKRWEDGSKETIIELGPERN